MPMYLRNKKDGTIYGMNEILAKHPLCEPVTEEEAFPERFMPARKSKVSRQLELFTDDIPEPKNKVSPEIARNASKGLPK